jgi:hypothetical protein
MCMTLVNYYQKIFQIHFLILPDIAEAVRDTLKSKAVLDFQNDMA